MKWCRFHCRRCGSHFSSLEAFDAHHGDEPCSFPDDADLIGAPGSCKIASGRTTAGTIYTTARSSRAADYFHPTNGPQTARAERSDAVAGGAIA